MSGRSRTVEPSEPGANPECRLTRDDGLRRSADTDKLFAHLAEQRESEQGNEFVFEGDPKALWDMVTVFVDEEAVCCPFFRFEQTETGNGVRLTVSLPGG